MKFLGPNVYSKIDGHKWYVVGSPEKKSKHRNSAAGREAKAEHPSFGKAPRQGVQAAPSKTGSSPSNE